MRELRAVQLCGHPGPHREESFIIKAGLLDLNQTGLTSLAKSGLNQLRDAVKNPHI